MAHERVYQDDDPLLVQLRPICLGLPESCEVEAWGRPTFRAGPKKLFVIYTADRNRPHSMVFKPDADERQALVQDERFFVPPYFGASGWLALDFTIGTVDWTEVAELADSSYRRVALKRMLTVLDAQ